jgi:hypothetical protein
MKQIKPEITVYVHTHVKPDEIFENIFGAIRTEGCISVSAPNGGCGSTGCGCSPGHWISATLPRTSKGVVKGMKLKFGSRKELKQYLGIMAEK